MRRLVPLLIVLVGCGAARPAVHAPSTAPDWQPLSSAVFASARDRHALVLLSLQADWCHFCHVMNDETFADPEVQDALARDFVVVREEADRRPDLVARWGLYGWPATIVLDENGEQLLALRGYRERSVFLGILRALIEDRDAGRVPGSSLPEAVRGGIPERTFDGALEDLRALAVAQADAAYDVSDAGWGRTQRYPFGALVEAALLRADIEEGAAIWRERGLRSLERYTRLIDPVWGGLYQYSVGGDWDHPHYEKLTDVQSGVLSALAAALETTGDARWREAAEAILRYLGEHMRSERGAFYVSQDADVRDGGPAMAGARFYALDAEGRAALGREPRIDRHLDADVNGHLIAALARYGFAASDPRAIAWAEAAADAIWASHCGDTGCAHEEGDGRRHLSDQAAMLAGLVELYQVSSPGEGARHLTRAITLAQVLREQLRDGDGGLRASVPIEGEPDLAGEVRPFLPGALAARALLMLDRLDEAPRGDGSDDGSHAPSHAEVARQALLALGDGLGRQGRIVGELLVALDLALEGTLRLTLVGEARDPRTRALLAAIALAGEPRRVLEQVLPSTSRYGDPGEPALFVCGAESCSLPITRPEAVGPALDGFRP